MSHESNRNFRIVLCMYLSNRSLPKEGVFDALHMFSAPNCDMLH